MRIGVSELCLQTQVLTYAGVRRCAFEINQKCIRRVGPTRTHAQNDRGRELTICRQNDVPTSQLLVTESARVDVT